MQADIICFLPISLEAPLIDLRFSPLWYSSFSKDPGRAKVYAMDRLCRSRLCGL